ncbi:hypothetical protein BBK36DRAFT_1158216 [Trichoderma citrinoviride]|uniref:Uncharacterized protein n=1 Tax=Trichoderma citrinoviride TaxID=58853 RepID=A0A2T4BDM9_9HYPO|nr:hypothetical protein BBK36DRAFT_1158216 [Trichoderma citrinoviride]PTB67378.1 hypothetical protein BBK36DRAFT_1158216 [Trichoderma citrinoviride]
MEATLLSSLHTKLDDLEGKMRAYRCDLLSDFQRYYHDLLADVPPSVASSVQRAIVQSFANYPTLRPELEAAVADSQPPRPAAFQQPAARIEPPGTPTTSSRDRETELRGLFTPSYLPLLDSSPPVQYDPRPAATSPGASTAAATASTTATQTTASVPLPPVMAPRTAGSGSGSGTATDHGITEGGLATAGNDTPPADPQALTEAHHLVRTATEESTSSINSDRSDAKARRSALRRSSSTSKPPQSPRRVRFEVMGAEVLPTSSPQQVEFLTPVASSPALEDDSIASGMILGGDMDEWEPPVRKSSSTEALRALSRAPAEEGTVWTVVNPDTDEDPSHSKNTTGTAQEKPTTSAEPNTSTANHHTTSIPLRAAQASNTTSSYSSDDVNNHRSDHDDDDGDSSNDDDDYLAMPKRNSPAVGKPASASLAQLPPKRAANGHSAAASLPSRSSINSSNSSNHVDRRNPPPFQDEPLADDGDDDDDMFEFEPGGLSAPPKPRERPPPPPDDDDDEEEELSDDSEDGVSDMNRPSHQPLYSTSPAVPIMRPARLENSMSTVSRFQPGSLGSYKGRPVVMPVVRNPEVHARAASLGNFNTFVGGLDGRSGMDEADLSSFRASFVRSGFTGTPRSFTERFMMEEAQAQAQAEKEGNGSAQ